MLDGNIVPEFLYQYTTIDALKCIVNNRTIRFKRSSLLNDPDESTIKVRTDKGYSNYQLESRFGSSWTSSQNESVAMWHMYADKLRGVRIKLRYDMFLKHGRLVIDNCGNHVWPGTQIEGIETCVFKDQKVTIRKVLGPIPVVYETARETLNHAVVQESNHIGKNNEAFTMNDIDLYEKAVRKMIHWEYEKEYRYILTPYIAIHGDINSFEQRLIIDPNCPEYIDIPIHKSIEEVVIGPRMSKKKSKEIIEFLYANGITSVNKSHVNYK